ncbi:MAG TPA: hydroxymethylbilane synthase, partial [Candidatus Thermoplasmatota archaeon]|nr:hydroxymethylbilane synthase [Candidatus Thermoplasmatota archaeon]
MIRVGTRKSPLAMAQTRLAVRLLKEATGIEAEIVPVTSQGDVNRVAPIHRIGRPGAFTHELEDAILDGRIDAAVHSLKDMPVQQPPEAPIAAVLPRGDVRDALIVHRDWHDASQTGLPLKPGARVGTSAPRRQAQLLAAAPEAIPVDVRGNVETRLRLVADGLLDALLMAEAPFGRVELPLPGHLLHVPLPADAFPGSPGQGAIAIQARAESEAFRAFRH